MIFPKSAVDKLGFTEVCNLIKDRCLSEAGRQMVEKIQPQISFEKISLFLNQTNELKELLLHDSPLPLDHIYPIKVLAEKVKVEGSFLTEPELYNLLLSLRTVFSLVRYFKERAERYPKLYLLFEQVLVEGGIVRLIEGVIDDNGVIKGNASKLLFELSKEILKAEQEGFKRLDAVFKHAQSQGWTAEGGVTIREGRLCIPILAENKRKIKGLVHDESSSGQTVYIEPEEVFNLNNRVRDLSFEKRREVNRILTSLTNEIRPFVPILLSYQRLITQVDFIRAKALLAIDLDAKMPVLTKGSSINLVEARHPFIYLNFLKNKEQKVIPLNINIDEKNRIVLVSGPNAGGKSVCLKTVGLLQIMLQSGLLIPVDEVSTVGVFNQIFADIGDDQSIESDLSTYSAHLSKMKHFTCFADAKTLLLIDEFGTGTDPQFGGPIAEAVLEQLNRKMVRGVVTTHYSNLKLFASHTDGMINASMLFDNQVLKPMYILQMGKPGSSYAFEIAQKIGLSKDILIAAKEKIGIQQRKVDSLLVDLERDKKEIIETKHAVSLREKELIQQKAKYEALEASLEKSKKEIIQNAKSEARILLKDVNKLIEKTISDIKTSKADKDITKSARSKLNKVKEEHGLDAKKDSTIKKNRGNVDLEDLKVGDWVRIEESGSEGEIMEITKNSRLIIALGELRTVVKRDRVTKLRSKEKSKAIKRTAHVSTDSIVDFKSEIDLRGLRTEEALSRLETVLDRAVVIGFPSLKIIHGKGDGILRKFIRQYLKKYSHVSRIEDEHADSGGDGITYAYIG